MAYIGDVAAPATSIGAIHKQIPWCCLSVFRSYWYVSHCSETCQRGADAGVFVTRMGKDSLEAVAAPDTNLARFYHHNPSNMTTQIRLAGTFSLQHSVLRYILIFDWCPQRHATSGSWIGTPTRLLWLLIRATAVAPNLTYFGLCKASTVDLRPISW